MTAWNYLKYYLDFFFIYNSILTKGEGDLNLDVMYTLGGADQLSYKTLGKYYLENFLLCFLFAGFYCLKALKKLCAWLGHCCDTWQLSFYFKWCNLTKKTLGLAMDPQNTNQGQSHVIFYCIAGLIAILNFPLLWAFQFITKTKNKRKKKKN